MQHKYLTKNGDKGDQLCAVIITKNHVIYKNAGHHTKNEKQESCTRRVYIWSRCINTHIMYSRYITIIWIINFIFYIHTRSTSVNFVNYKAANKYFVRFDEIFFVIFWTHRFLWWRQTTEWIYAVYCRGNRAIVFSEMQHTHTHTKSLRTVLSA